MLIILEGVEGAGKTSIANCLKNDFGYHIYTTERPRNTSNKFDFSSLWRGEIKSIIKLLHIISKEKIVFDRLHLSEFVYSCLYSHYAKNFDIIKEVDKELLNYGARIVYCYAKPQTLLTRVKNKLIDEFDKDFMVNYTKHLSLFQEALMLTSIKMYYLNTGEVSVKEGVNDILNVR